MDFEREEREAAIRICQLVTTWIEKGLTCPHQEKGISEFIDEVATIIAETRVRVESREAKEAMLSILQAFGSVQMENFTHKTPTIEA